MNGTFLERAAARLAALAAIGCGAAADGEAPRGSLALTPVTDTNPAPDVVEVQLVAAPGRVRYLAAGAADVWGYRDGARAGAAVTVPGPLIEARRGDRVIVHFRNELPEATTIHWHGVRVPNRADGTPSTQAEVPGRGGTFDYEFTADDEGTFWYHPHVHGDVQIERGLYGVLVVHGGPDIPVEADRAFVLDDVKLEADGRLSDRTEALDLMLGRLGNVLLVNGAAGAVLPVKSGARERWRFVNSANGRYFNLRLPGHTFTVIAWDGGLLHRPYTTDTLLVAPGERYEVLVSPRGAPGATATLETIHYDRGHDIPDAGPQPLMKLRFLGEAGASGDLPATWGEPPALAVPDGARTRALELDEEEPKGPGEEPRFFINKHAFPHVPPIEGRPGDVEIWSVRNETEMDHPFHLHGMFFRVLDVAGKAPEPLGWKDTVNVPRKATLRFAVRYGTPGRWMYHCHILEHAERGMMGDLVLAAPR